MAKHKIMYHKENKAGEYSVSVPVGTTYVTGDKLFSNKSAAKDAAKLMGILLFGTGKYKVKET